MNESQVSVNVWWGTKNSEDFHLEMYASESLALAELKVPAHEEIHERASLRARLVQARTAAAQDLHPRTTTYAPNQNIYFKQNI